MIRLIDFNIAPFNRTVQSSRRAFRSKGVTSTSHIAPFRTFSRGKVASSATFEARSITADRNPTRNACYKDHGETERVAELSRANPRLSLRSSRGPFPTRLLAMHPRSRVSIATCPREERSRYDDSVVKYAPIFCTCNKN